MSAPPAALDAAEAGDTFGIRRFARPGDFYRHAEPFLLSAEAEYNLIIGLSRNMERHGAPPDSLFAAVEQGGRVVGCIMRTPPEKLLLTRLPLAAIPTVEAFVADVCESLPAVLAAEGEGRAFAERWSARRGVRYRPGMQQGIHELTQLTPPERPAPGSMRRATPADVPLVARWLIEFSGEADHPLADAERVAAERVERGVFRIWEDGGPVCLAGRMAPTPHGDRIGYVYTPPALRGRGYASALVAALTRELLDDGLRFACLYTDLANATSNAIYRRLGYRLVAQVMNHDFVA